MKVIKPPCRGCTKRCAEPLCKNRCEAWSVYQDNRNAVYEDRKKQYNGCKLYIDTSSCKKYQEQIKRRKNGWY